MKRTLIVILAAVMIVMSFAACGQKKEEAPIEEAASGTELVGAWEIQKDLSDFDSIPDDVQAAFDKAMEGYTGMGFVPYAYVGRQIVSGTNYMILACGTTVTAEPQTGLYMLVIYEDTEGNATIKSVKDFDIAAIEEAEPADTPFGVAGGWQLNDRKESVGMPDMETEVIKKVLEGDTSGVTYVPLSRIIAEKIVSGAEFALLAAEYETPDSQPQVCMLYLYDMADGTTSLKSVRIDITAYNE